MSLSLNPTGKKKSKPELNNAARTIAKSDEYRYNIVIDRSTMFRYQALCKTRRVSPQDEIKRFIERELNRFNDLVP